MSIVLATHHTKNYIKWLIDYRHLPVHGVVPNADRWIEVIASFHKSLARCYLDQRRPRLPEHQELNAAIMV